MTDPWAFGWTQIFTVAGLLLTGGIAVFGFRTFGRWKAEVVEAKRIDVAFDALSVAYETKFIFGNIRAALVEGYEWEKMERRPGESDDQWNRRGTYYAVLERIRHNKDFFEKVWHVQPKCMTVFGPEIEATFMKLHQARRHIEVAAQMLARHENDQDDPDREQTRALYEQLRRDMYDHGDFEREKDRVGRMLREFTSELEAKARPSVDREYSRRPMLPSWLHRAS